MRVVFAGTPEFARVALERLLQAGFSVPLVLTQPDRPAGRGMKLQASPVKQCALAHGIAVAQPHSLRLDGKFSLEASEARAALEAAQADVMVVAAYGLILPQWTLDLPRWGCLNIHASLLPRWRGAAPIHRAIEAGDAETGVTIMQMDAGLDTGAMLRVERLPITTTDTTTTLHDQLAVLGGQMMVQVLQVLQQANTADAANTAAVAARLPATPQPAQGVNYAHKIEKAESTIHWQLPATVIGQRIRAFDPFPGASTQAQGEVIKLWAGAVVDVALPAGVQPGQIIQADEHGVLVACGQGAMRLAVLQRAGGKRLAAADFLRGFALQPGMMLGADADVPTITNGPD